MQKGVHGTEKQTKKLEESEEVFLNLQHSSPEFRRKAVLPKGFFCNGKKPKETKSRGSTKGYLIKRHKASPKEWVGRKEFRQTRADSKSYLVYCIYLIR